jgi:hypothetical protein
MGVNMVIATKNRRGTIFIPVEVFKPNWLIKINSESVNDYIIESKTTLNKLPLISNTSIKLSNLNGRFLKRYSAGQTIEVWADYTTNDPPDNKIFNGRIDNINYGLSKSDGWVVYLEGRQAPQVKDVYINESFNNSEISTAIKTIIDNYPLGITYTNVTGTSVNTTVSFRNVPASQAIGELLERGNQDGYIDSSLDLHTFTKESIVSSERANFGNNVLSVPRIGKDYDDVKNRIVVYGNSDNNMLLLKTEEDTSSQTSLWRKDLVITDSNMDEMDEIQDKANTELTNNLTAETKGKINVVGVPALNPGETMRLSVPYCDLNGYFVINSLTHFIKNGFITNLDIKKKSTSLSELFKERINAESGLSVFSNPNNLENSYRINFDESPSVLTHSNTEETNGTLVLSSGQTTGNAVSNVVTADKNITKLELRVYGTYPDIENCVYKISIDNGISWLTVNPGVLYTSTDGSTGEEYFNNTEGKKLKVKIELLGDSTHTPIFEGVTALYI